MPRNVPKAPSVLEQGAGGVVVPDRVIFLGSGTEGPVSQETPCPEQAKVVVGNVNTLVGVHFILKREPWKAGIIYNTGCCFPPWKASFPERGFIAN